MVAVRRLLLSLGRRGDGGEISFHHHFEQFAFLATDDGVDHAVDGRGEVEARVALVGDQRLAGTDGVALGDSQSRRKAYHVGRLHGIEVYAAQVGDVPLGNSRQRHIEAFLYFYIVCFHKEVDMLIC